MNRLANDTLADGGPGMRAVPPDPTRYLLRVVRRAMRLPAAATPLDRAIRSAVALAGPDPADDPAARPESRLRLVANRMTALLAPRLATGRAHLTTVH